MSWSVLGLLVAAAWCQVLVRAQLDIVGHKQLGQIQDTDTASAGGVGGVKTKKQFAVYDAVAVLKKNLTGTEITDNSVSDSVLSDGASPNVTNDGEEEEMVSYSTKFSVSLKNNKEEERIDRNSYQYPSYSVGQLQQPSAGGIGGGYLGGVAGNSGGYLGRGPGGSGGYPGGVSGGYLGRRPGRSGGYLGGGVSPGYLGSSYLQYPPLSENLTPGQQYPGSQSGYYQSQPPQYPQYQQYQQYSPPYQSPHYQSYPGPEYRQSLPYGELFPSQDYLFSPQSQSQPGSSQEYLTAPLQFDTTDLTEPSAELSAKSEQKPGEHAEKRGLGLGGLGGIGPIGGPLGIPPHAGGYLGPIGGFGGHIGGLRPGGLLRPGLPHRLPHPVPVPVPVQVPVVRTFHTKHLNQHDHLHKHKNTHSHKHNHSEEHKHKHTEEHDHVHRHTHHHDHHHNHKHKSEQYHDEYHKHKHGHLHQVDDGYLVTN